MSHLDGKSLEPQYAPPRQEYPTDLISYPIYLIIVTVTLYYILNPLLWLCSFRSTAALSTINSAPCSSSPASF